MTHLRHRLTFSNVTSALALFVVLGGGALAASTIGGGGSIAACYKTSGKSKGLVRLVASGSKCKHGEKAIAWNQSGPAGEAGAKGATGVTGAAGTNGTNGAKGDTGAPGSTIVARLQGFQDTLNSGQNDGNVGFLPSTWPQAAGEDQLVMAVLTVNSPFTGCTGAQSLLVSLTLNGVLLNPVQATSPGAEPFLAVPVQTLNPQAGGTNTITASAINSCPNPATFHVDVNIVSFK